MYEQGAPAVLRYEQETIGEPCHDQVLVRQAAIGVNHADVDYRNGSAHIDRFPFINGFEAAGTVEATGPGVRDFRVGERVAYHFAPGAYAEARLISAHQLIPLPDDVTFEQAAAVFAKGLTAHMLVKRVYPITAGDLVVVHAATGGVSTLVARWAKALGATVIEIVGSGSNSEAAHHDGVDYVIATDNQDFRAHVREITEANGVDVVYGEVGLDTLVRSLDLIRPFGKIVLFEWAAGAPDPVDTVRLLARSTSVVTPAVSGHIPDRDSLERAAAAVFSALRTGVFGDVPVRTYPLSRAAAAHADLEQRRTTGPVVLVPTPYEDGYVRQPEISPPTHREDFQPRARTPQSVRASAICPHAISPDRLQLVH
jgi:NADPH2:quinone reductase